MVTVKDIFELDRSIENVEITVRDGGKWVMRYAFGCGVKPNRYMSFSEETKEGTIYIDSAPLALPTLFNDEPIDNYHPGKTIPKSVLDLEISSMKPWNTWNTHKSERYSYSFECCKGGWRPPEKKQDDEIEGQMSIEDFLKE